MNTTGPARIALSRRVYELRKSGAPLKNIAAEIGCSIGKVVGLIRTAERAELCEKHPHWSNALSIRAKNALINLDLQLNSLDAVKAEFLAGNIFPGCRRNYSHKTHAEIVQLLQLPDPHAPKPKPAPKPKCPHCGQRMPVA